jgi:hypothetical protein
MRLHKTTIVIWTDYNPEHLELSDLALAADRGDAYCSRMKAEDVETETDPDWDGSEFFANPDDDED